jgi:hypothetical protein
MDSGVTKNSTDDLTKDDWKTRFEAALDTRRLELGFFWQRSLFFWGFIAVAFAGFMAAKKENYELLALLFICFGLVCAFVWTLGNRGSKYWYEYWEAQVEEAERFVVGPLFTAKPKVPSHEWLSARRFSVSKLAIALSDFVCGLCTFLCIGQTASVAMHHGSKGVLAALITLALTAFYLFLIWKYARSGGMDTEGKKGVIPH